MIPKIIHQTGPSKKENWHPLWSRCQESWLKQFSDYEYKFWNDEEIDELIRVRYPEYWDMYDSFPVHIMKIDFVRFCILDSYGGIYADLDYYCYKNFDHLLVKKTYVVENPFGNDPIENSLMCSESNSLFFKKCMEKTKERFVRVKSRYNQKLTDVSIISKDKDYGALLRPYLIFFISGTNLVSTVFRENKNLSATLPGFFFNNLDYSYDESYYTKHTHTGLWGKENIEIKNISKNVRNIPPEHYDFYYDYSNGEYKTKYFMNYDKNDVESSPSLNLNYGYF